MTVETYNSDPIALIDSIAVTDAAIAHFRRLLNKKAKKGRKTQNSKNFWKTKKKKRSKKRF